MSTISDVMEQLKSGPKTSGELRKVLGKSSGAISGALWRLEQGKAVKASETANGLNREFALTGKPFAGQSRSSPTHPVLRRKRRTHNSAIVVQATVRIELPGKSPLILTLSEASRLYEALGAVATQLLGAGGTAK